MFERGLEYVRADFHLHTRRDKEFVYVDAENDFIKNYVSALKNANIQIGAITNHNKFDYEEFKALRKVAQRADIYLLPGVELSVKEGANGIHTLIIFNPDEWLEQDYEHIQSFLSSALANIPHPENKNSKCKFDLRNTLETLESYGKDYFVIFAHVDQNSGLFNECKCGLLSSLSSIANFQKRVLGLQKSRVRDNLIHFNRCFGYSPALVEGSDPKSIDDIGKGVERTYIKIGDFSYASVKFALQDYRNRVFYKPSEIMHGFIESIAFIGGKFDGQKIMLSPHLNTIIGTRGSGKSSIIETIRYLFDIPSQIDKDYKDGLVEKVLGSGGKIILTLLDKYGHRYTVSRISGESINVVDAHHRDLNVSPTMLLEGFQYFGQKDMSTVKNYENIFFNSIAPRIRDKRNLLKDCYLKLKEAVEQLLKFNGLPEEIKMVSLRKAELEHKMTIYQERGVAQKLKKQTGYAADKTRLLAIKEQLDLLTRDAHSAYNANPSLLGVIRNLNSDYNEDIIGKVKLLVDSLNKRWIAIGTTLHDMQVHYQSTFDDVFTLLEKRIASFSDEFAKIKREIKDDTLNADDFVKMSKDLETTDLQLSDLKEKFTSKKNLESAFVCAMNQRNELLLDTFNLYKNELEEINTSQDNLQIKITFKGDKGNFKEQLKNDFRGTGISDIKYQKIVEQFSDYVDIINDWLMSAGEKLKTILTDTEYIKTVRRLTEQYDELLQKCVENKIDIYYHGKPLKQHSVGQRASALILFILTQTNNDVIVIDQPEDDLDNKVIYDELIQAIMNKKDQIQFIFATHNANIPVLGDSDRILVVNYRDTSIDISQGNIDLHSTQQQIIDIMEGGQEAFKKRKLIYNTWHK